MNEFQITNIENGCCLACGQSNLRTILDLGDQPLANSYHRGEALDKFPLKLNLCTNCYHLQLSHAVNPDLMFKHYLYVSGTSRTLREYFGTFAQKTLEYVPKAKAVLDIACNDGTQLDAYKERGLDTFGIDPAENLYQQAIDKGHEIVCDYFTSETVQKFQNKTFDIITAQNVFAHTRYTTDFLQACKKVMHEESVLFIQTSQANMVANNEFDTIYHEHLSFFNTNSMKVLVERCGLVLKDVFKTDIHGTSYVFVITKPVSTLKQSALALWTSEKDAELYNILTYPVYASKCYKATYKLKQELIKFKNEGYKLVGYGAAAKGNTLLNFGSIELDVIVDDNELKQGLLTPGMNIQIVPPSYVDELGPEDKVVFVPLAWNFFNEIVSNITSRRTNPTDIFIQYFPEFLTINNPIT